MKARQLMCEAVSSPSACPRIRTLLRAVELALSSLATLVTCSIVSLCRGHFNFPRVDLCLDSSRCLAINGAAN